MPGSAYVARFMGGQNVLRGPVEASARRPAAPTGENGARFEFPLAGPAGSTTAAPLCSPPSAATASPSRRCRSAPSRRGGLNTVIGEVHTIENQGSYVKVTLGFAGDAEEFVANVADDKFFANPLDIGDRVLARWSASDIILLDSGPLAAAPGVSRTVTATGR